MIIVITKLAIYKNALTLCTQLGLFSPSLVDKTKQTNSSKEPRSGPKGLVWMCPKRSFSVPWVLGFLVLHNPESRDLPYFLEILEIRVFQVNQVFLGFQGVL